MAQGAQYATINSNGRININSGVQNQTLAISCTVDGSTATRVIEVTYDNQLSIEGSDSMSGTSGTVVARYNGTVVTPTWSITSGNATISNNGMITIVQSEDITVSATYNGYTTTKNISLTYSANTTSETIVEEDGSVTTITETTIENQDGSTRTETSSTTMYEDGSYSQTQSQTIEN